MALLGRSGDEMKSTYSRGHALVSGETVTAGQFRCSECGYEYRIHEGVKNLPVCPECQGEEWELER